VWSESVNQGQSVSTLSISGPTLRLDALDALIFKGMRPVRRFFRIYFFLIWWFIFGAPVILLSEDLIGGLAQEIMICGAMSGSFLGFTALQMPSMIDRIWP